VLCEAYRELRKTPGIGRTRLIVAGYLAPEHQPYLTDIKNKMRDWGLADQFEYRGEVDRAQKMAFLQSLDLFSVPATYEEPKGLFLLEALASGVPVVQPRRGAFPEIVNNTGGGLIVEAGSPAALAAGLLELRRNPEKAAALAAAGATGVREHYDVGRMAEAAEQAYRSIAASS
jgi:glycosyltransferase involved in cell wall biosynthesis